MSRAMVHVARAINVDATCMHVFYLCIVKENRFIYKSSVDLSANNIYGQIFKKLYNCVSRAWKHVLG